MSVPNRARPLALVLALSLVTACAVVDSVRRGFTAVGRWADGFFRGEGEVVDGEQEGEWRYEYEDGSPRARYTYEDDARHGPAETYYPDGSTEAEGAFRNGRREGIWTYWHENGRIRAQGAFHEDREYGEWVFWNARGQRTKRGQFDARGLPTLLWTYSHPDGTRKAEGAYYENERVGLWSFWDREGNPTQDHHPMPEGVELVVERWPDGAVRREGFLLQGRPHGLWVTRHPNGEARLSGTFENGVPNGRCVATRETGERLGAGPMEVGRPRGTWTVRGPGGDGPWSAAGAGPPPPFSGEWSEGSVAEREAFGDVLATWLAEAASPVPDGAVVRSEPEAAPPSEDQVAATEEDPGVPVLAQPWTAKQLADFELAKGAYLSEGGQQSELASRYAGRPGAKASGPGGGGTPDVARRYLGEPLPMTRFRGETGGRVDLEDFRGQRVLLVVLRGFDGELCPYCAAQTESLGQAWVTRKLEQLGVRVLIVFPGDKNCLEAFVDGYKAIAQRQAPPHRFLFERDALVGQDLRLVGNKVIPATFLLDEEGLVRFAYVGENEADRPSVDVLFEAIENLGPAQ